MFMDFLHITKGFKTFIFSRVLLDQPILYSFGSYLFKKIHDRPKILIIIGLHNSIRTTKLTFIGTLLVLFCIKLDF